MSETRRKWILTAATLLWFCFMLFLSQESGEKSGIVTQQVAQQLGQSTQKMEQLSYWDGVKLVNRIHRNLRSLAHVGVFSVLGALLVLTTAAWNVRQVYAAASLTVWSVLDEALKLGAQGRHCDVSDIVKNGMGSALGFGAGIFLIILCKRKKTVERSHGTD